MEAVKCRYYKVQQIKELEQCGRDEAYRIAQSLPHEVRGRKIFVFAEDYDNYYKQKREKALEKIEINKQRINNIYQIRKFS